MHTHTKERIIVPQRNPALSYLVQLITNSIRVSTYALGVASCECRLLPLVFAWHCFPAVLPQ